MRNRTTRELVYGILSSEWWQTHGNSLFDIVMELQHITQIPIDANSQTIIEGLTSRLEDKQIKRLLTTLTLNVPYRFLRPWIDTSDDKEMVRRSQTLENGSLYALYKEGSDFYIVLNQAWDAWWILPIGI